VSNSRLLFCSVHEDDKEGLVRGLTWSDGIASLVSFPVSLFLAEFLGRRRG
jgi:hypothetical protein